jgi:SOS-response transcriptional repressor LexA
MPTSLTPKRLAVLQFIATTIHNKGVAPTLREVGDQLGVKKTTALEHVAHLIEKGWLVKEPHVSRGLLIAPGVVVPGMEPTRIQQLERECRLLARLSAGLITDPQILPEAKRMASRWLADAAAQAVRS